MKRVYPWRHWGVYFAFHIATLTVVAALVVACRTGAPDVVFTLETSIDSRGLAFTGTGGEIDRVRNPALRVSKGAVIQIILINGDGINHDLAAPDFEAATRQVSTRGARSTLTFRADKEGEFSYFCSRPGHRDGGMEGRIVVEPRPQSGP